MADVEEKAETTDYSPLINVKAFKDQILRELSITELERNKCETSYSKLAEEMGITTETVAELDEVCRWVLILCTNCPGSEKRVFLHQDTETTCCY